MKKILPIAFALVASLAFGKANDTVITFSTPGPDTYADGSTVLDGECYALVWTKDGATFGGLSVDCKPLAATDKLVLVAPVAEAGRCPTTVFEIDADYAAANYQGGSYSVYLLDTRIGGGKLAALKNGIPTSVNSLGNTAGVSKSASGDATTGFADSLKAGSAVALADVGVYTEIPAPKIDALRIEEATVSITVSGMFPDAADYFVVPGSSPASFSKALSTKPVGDTFTFENPKNASFFRVIGARKTFK